MVFYKKQNRLAKIIADSLFFPLIFFIAQCLGSGGWEPLRSILGFPSIAVALLSLITAYGFGFYRIVTRHVGRELVFYATGASLISLGFLCLGLFLGIPLGTNYSPILIYGALMCLYLILTRFIVQAILCKHGLEVAGRIRAVIYGAGAAGAQLLQVLSRDRRFSIEAFIDDNPVAHGGVIGGKLIYLPDDLSYLIASRGVTTVLMAMPSIAHSRRAEIIHRLKAYPVKALTMPSIGDLASGKSVLSELREIEIDDLLSRDPVLPDENLLNGCIAGRVILVTGAGGSIGSEICKKILPFKPAKLIVLDSSEYALYALHAQLEGMQRRTELNVELRPLLGNIQDRRWITNVLRSNNIDVLYHAAAYKHVPLVERNIDQGILNNVLGTLAVVEASVEVGISSLVLVSTDKAVRPTNIMGATKRLAELIVQAYAKKIHGNKFCIVRFGNVLGSSGSVVPLFKTQIAAGGPVTVTHPEMIRYFMSIPEAAELVIQAGALAEGGDLFLLDMGKPVRIAELAKSMIRLMGRTVKDESEPDGDIEIKYTGLRPGEKLYEELLIDGKSEPTRHPRIYRAKERSIQLDELLLIIDRLKKAADNLDDGGMVEVLLQAPLDYSPQGGGRQ